MSDCRRQPIDAPRTDALRIDCPRIDARRRALIAGFTAAGVLGWGAAGTGPAAAQPTGTLRISVNLNPSTLDPATGRSGGDHQFLFPLYDTLIRWNPRTIEPIPGLATSWTYRDDTTLVLELRAGVTFHDGTPLDAQAVKFNLDRARQDVKSNIKVDLTSVESVEASGPTTVILKLKAPDRSLPLILSDRAGMIASPAAIRAGGGSIDRAPVGSGPWKFVRWEDNSIVAYERNPSYWESGLPKIDRLEMRVIPEVATGVRAVVAGESDLVVSVPPLQKTVLERQAKLEVFATSTLYLHMIYLDFSRPPFNDVRVRRALNLAIDRAAFSKATMAGLAETATTLYPKEFWPYDASLAGLLEYDPDKARALLKEAGTPQLTFTGVAYADQAAIKKQEVLMEMWSKVGLTAKMRSATVAEASGLFFQQRQVDMFLAAITPRPDPVMAPTILFAKDSFYNGGKQELPGMEAALAAARSGTTQAQRKEALSRVQRIAIEQAAFVPLMFDVSVIAVNRRFEGFEPNLMARPKYERVALVS